MKRIERRDEGREDEVARPPELLVGLEGVASAIGNRSFTEFVVSARPHPQLDPAVPAGSRRRWIRTSRIKDRLGSILNPAALPPASVVCPK